MALRRPLVVVGGNKAELPNGDALSASYFQATGNLGANQNAAAVYDFYPAVNQARFLAFGVGANPPDFLFYSGASNASANVLATLQGTTGNLYLVGNLYAILPASVAPNRNKEMAFQLTNDTTLTVKVRGSDGVVRTVSFTLS